jgi:hypothetical protein
MRVIHVWLFQSHACTLDLDDDQARSRWAMVEMALARDYRDCGQTYFMGHHWHDEPSKPRDPIVCQGCKELFIPEGNEILCPACNATIDEATDLLLEERHFDSGPGY